MFIKNLMEDTTSALDRVVAALPALPKVQTLGELGAGVGFDWPDASGPTRKIAEELAELEEARRGSDKDHVVEELGDLLFAVVNLARHLEVDAEEALAGANRKFEQRFRHMEQAIRADGRELGELGIDTLEAYWQAAKAQPDTHN